MSSHRRSFTFDTCRAPRAAVTIACVSGEPGRCVVEVGGELEPATEQQLTAFIDQTVAQDQPSHVTLDLSAVTLCTAAGVRALVRAQSAVTAHGGRLTLRDPAPGVLKVLALTGDLDRFEIQTGERAAA